MEWSISEKESELKNLRASNREQLSEAQKDITRLREREQELQVHVVTLRDIKGSKGTFLTFPE
jgi:FKBP-type peptidyl-prolyl cis-trans isomerase (trigger factor)